MMMVGSGIVVFVVLVVVSKMLVCVNYKYMVVGVLFYFGIIFFICSGVIS